MTVNGVMFMNPLTETPDVVLYKLNRLSRNYLGLYIKILKNTLK